MTPAPPFGVAFGVALGVTEAREATISELSDQFAQDRLGLEEFERRVTLAHRAGTVSELAALIGDLPGGAARLESLARPQPAPLVTSIVSANEVRDKQTVTAILGGVQRRGSWTAPRLLEVVAVMGGVELDFREARLGVGVTTVNIFAMMGGIDITIPPGLAVEVEGTAILGGFEHLERTPAELEPDRPLLRVTGMVVMGGVAVRTRLPGERGWGREHTRLAAADHRGLPPRR